MARVFSLIIFGCILFGLAYTDTPKPRCQDANKEYQCRSDWDTGKCADIHKSPPFVPTPQNVCKCYCSRGLWETYSGKCVPADKCPTCKDANKVWECRSNWDTGKCVDRHRSPPFVPTPQNVCKCFCSRGLWETDSGKCVPGDKCPKCTTANKVWECRSNWDTGKCVDRYKSPPIVSTPRNVCKCYCSRGLWETHSGKCVPADKCP